MTTKEERLSFLEEMKDVRRIRKPNRAEVATPRELTPGHLERQRAAVEKPLRDTNPLTSDMVEPLTAHDVLSWQRPGVQHGVFRKLRLGQYPIEARLDLALQLPDGPVRRFDLAKQRKRDITGNVDFEFAREILVPKNDDVQLVAGAGQVARRQMHHHKNGGWKCLRQFG